MFCILYILLTMYGHINVRLDQQYFRGIKDNNLIYLIFLLISLRKRHCQGFISISQLVKINNMNWNFCILWFSACVGSFGENFSQPCHFGLFGINGIEKCNCSSDTHWCDNIFGCKNKDTGMHITFFKTKINLIK